jgi:hypothetical protein
MSAVDLTLALDNRVNVSAEATKIVRISGVQNNFFEINPEGQGFTSSIIFQNVITPSLSNTLVSRNMRLRYVVTASATATPPVLPPYTAFGAGGAVCALRAHPLQSICENIQMTLNGATTTIPSRYVISATQRTLPADWVRKEATEAPVMSDNSACLSVDDADTLQSQQPLSSYYNSDGTTRVSFLPVAYDDAGHTVSYEVSESLMISPLTIRSEENFLANINTLSFQLNFSQLNDMFCFGQSVAVPAGFSVAISNPRLELTYIQVAQDVVQIPRLVSYPYENLVYFTKQFGTLAHTAGGVANLASFQVQSDTIRLQSMPSLIYVFARPQITGRTSAIAQRSQADAFLSLGAPGAGGFMPTVSVNIGNRTGLLTSASAKTLYRMSVRNGYKATYNDWQWGSGSLLVIDPVEDLGVNLQAGDILPGESGSVNFQISATYSNANYLASFGQAGGADITGLPLELVIVPVYSGVVSITPDNCVFNIGELSESEVNALLRTAPKDGSMVSSEQIKPTIEGGALFGKHKSILGHTARGMAPRPMRGGIITSA